MCNRTPLVWAWLVPTSGLAGLLEELAQLHDALLLDPYCLLIADWWLGRFDCKTNGKRVK